MMLEHTTPPEARLRERTLHMKHVALQLLGAAAEGSSQSSSYLMGTHDTAGHGESAGVSGGCIREARM